ncbi:MAG: hypothetical protein AAF288_09695 [Planctomycetota bacterium]
MIEALKDDRLIHRMGGRFKFTALVQHRLRELMDGARPLVERNGRSAFELAVAEVVEGKLAYRLTEEEMMPESVVEALTEAGEKTTSARQEAANSAAAQDDIII